MAEGIQELGLSQAEGVVDANIKDCLGSGYCNIGCAYGKKLSALDNILPRAQRDFPGAVRIFSECMAESIDANGRRAKQVRCRLGDGRKLRVAANTVVSPVARSHPACCSSAADLGGSGVGTGLSFNVGAPLTADFDEKLNAFDGLQITHGYRPPGEDQLILESWFNPVGHPGADDARLVLGPLPQHAALRAPELHRGRRRLAAERAREARLPRQGA